MNCMKCGCEIQPAQVFCDRCLAVMQKYPVKADIRVQLPVRPSGDAKASAKKAPPSPEAQILRLRRQNKRLLVALLCSVLALALSIVLLFHMTAPETPENDLGKNYSTANADSRP